MNQTVSEPNLNHKPAYPTRTKELLNFPTRNTLARVEGVLQGAEAAAGHLGFSALFDLALFKHSDHPAKLHLMDRALPLGN